MSRKTIAIIPARGGSKRCAGKNVAMFKGRPLIAHTIEQAEHSRVFDKIIVSTDDPKVISIAVQYDVQLDNREENLADDVSTVLDVIRNLILKYNIDHGSILGLLQVTAPLREIEDIIESYNLFCSSGKNNSVVSVTQNEFPIELSWKIENDQLKPFFEGSENKSARKQDYTPTYRWNDAVIFDLAGNFMNQNRNLFGNSSIPYIMPPERSINIDYEFQLKLVQLIGRYWDKMQGKGSDHA